MNGSFWAKSPGKGQHAVGAQFLGALSITPVAGGAGSACTEGAEGSQERKVGGAAVGLREEEFPGVEDGDGTWPQSVRAGCVPGPVQNQGGVLSVRVSSCLSRAPQAQESCPEQGSFLWPQAREGSSTGPNGALPGSGLRGLRGHCRILREAWGGCPVLRV